MNRTNTSTGLDFLPHVFKRYHSESGISRHVVIELLDKPAINNINCSCAFTSG